MPKVSIILPCYNVEKYIGYCLDTLINQTLKDIEIICVDDKSKDNTVDVIKKYTKKDPRIKLIEQDVNTGVSVARNTGIDVATGEYIGFVDPDDYVDLDFYEKLYNSAKQSDADISKAMLNQILTTGVLKKNTLNKLVAENKLNFTHEFSSAIYRKKLLDDTKIRFLPNTSIGEDVNFQVKVAYLANKITVVNTTAYIYVRRDDSAYGEKLTRQKIEDVCTASNDLFRWLNERSNISKSDYLDILHVVYNLLQDNIGRAMTHQDKEYIARHIINTYKQSRNKRIGLARSFKKNIRKSIICANPYNVIKSMAYEYKRIKLFGFLPVIKIMRAPAQEYQIQLFDLITLYRYEYGKFRDSIYICGILFMKITH